MEELIENLFGEEATYKARYKLAKSQEQRPHPIMDTFQHHAVLTHDNVLLYLAPHEIQSLLRTCKATLNSHTSLVERRFLYMRSIFAYLRISKEAADNVAAAFKHGWKAMGPLLIQMCEYLAFKVYGHLEVDVVHRCFLAEQICFSNREWPYFGSLAGYEKYMEEVGAVPMNDESAEGTKKKGKVALKTMEELRRVETRQICWGDPETCLGVNERLEEYIQKHNAWMHENSKDAPNQHYQKRLEQKLHPSIWIFYDNQSEPIEWALGIGPNLEQFVSSASSYSELSTWENQRDKMINTFFTCFTKEDSEIGSGGMIKFLLGFPCAPEEMLEYQPTVGIAIWCMRHGLEPLTDESIEWEDIISAEMEDSEADEQFLLEALTSPLYGPADVKNYMV